ncbi:MAG: sigma-70 family RNA polymerase sigma factor [Polyangiaceae bacterium]|nr:sigma-70 family RNA polymerase sigma factor [Polyangiaceae bacterium]
MTALHVLPATPTSHEDLHAADVALVAGLITGDDGAWRTFQQRYDRLIYRCITRVTGRFAARLATDDVAEIYATLLLSLVANDKHKLRSFDPCRGNRFSSWVGMLAVNAAYDHLRSVKRDAGKAAIHEADSLQSELPDPFEVCAERERASRVEEALADFSAKDRAFMDLYYGEGLTPEQVANRMNISVKTVYSKKHKIQSKLEVLLGHEHLAA